MFRCNGTQLKWCSAFSKGWYFVMVFWDPTLKMKTESKQAYDDICRNGWLHEGASDHDLTICFPVRYPGGGRLFKPRWPLGSLGIVASFTWMQNVTLKFNTARHLIRQLVAWSILDFLDCPMAPEQAYFLLGNNIQKCLIPAMLCPPQDSQLGKPSKRWTIDFFSEQKKWTSSFQGIVMVWWNKWYSVYNPGR